MIKDTQSKLSPVTVTLHWIVGLTIITLCAVGVFMAETDTYFLYPWHKAFGVLIFTVVILRVWWRLNNGWPTPVREYARIEQSLSRIVHWVLIISTLVMPVSGFVMSAVGGHGVAVFGLELVARNPDPADPTSVIAHSKMIASTAHSIHHWAGYTLITAIVLHVAGACKHHFADRDGTLRRMLGKAV